MTYHPSDARAWALESGEPVSAHGRLSYQVVTAYLRAHPKITRSLAAECGVDVSARGAISIATVEELTVLVR